MGTPEFALPSLDALFAAGLDIAAVVTATDKPAGRGRHLMASPVKLRALTLGLPLLQPEELRDPQFIRRLQELSADLFIVVAFRILPPEVFTLPRLGTINLHASLLPKFRGAAPIQWAIIEGEKETGVTTFLIDEKVDTGQWLMQRPVLIGPEMTGGELHDLLARVGAEVLLQTVEGWYAGKLQPQPQQGQATRAPKLTKEMTHINWNQPAQRVYNLIRALAPYPGAYTLLRDKQIKILRTKLVDYNLANTKNPGTILRIDTNGDIFVATQDQPLIVLELQPEGRRVMTCSEFTRGYDLSIGDELL